MGKILLLLQMSIFEAFIDQVSLLKLVTMSNLCFHLLVNQSQKFNGTKEKTVLKNFNKLDIAIHLSMTKITWYLILKTPNELMLILIEFGLKIKVVKRLVRFELSFLINQVHQPVHLSTKMLKLINSCSAGKCLKKMVDLQQPIILS